MTVTDALTALAQAGFEVTGVAEYVEHGVRVRVTFSTTRHPLVGLSRLVNGTREHLQFDSYHQIDGQAVPFDNTSAVSHAIDLAGTTAKWEVKP